MNEVRQFAPVERRGTRRAIFVAAVTLSSLGPAGLFFREGFGGVLYDSLHSFHYFTFSQIVSTEGLWNLHSRVDTYGYLLFASLATGFSTPGPEATRALVFVAQLVVYLGASFRTCRAAERAFGMERAFYGTYLVMA